ncbi:hypothetical protein [Streptomyces silaceus]|uniref:hypothetical protein n=1 Tax=Streptomyces silaceus TaxID=545123 RepID=UPI0006EB2A56|nr:hypothetical protein [Streptomyces silaceus]
MTGRGRPDVPGPAECTHWIGPEHHHCRFTHQVRLYLTGPRCPDHTPNALRGRPEPPPGPSLPAGAWTTPSPLSDSALFDDRAVASGKRRSTPHTYRTAQAAVHHQKGT